MGRILEYSCPACGSKWEVSPGVGLLHGTLEPCIKAFDPGKIMKIQKDLAGYDTSRWYNGNQFLFEFRCSICDKCKELVTAPVLKVKESGRLYIGICEKCGGEVHPADVSALLMCPECRTKQKLIEREKGHWD
jgi:predicted RNA-binding Zn-ribbon protein involved in translation (DUF1610 family)